MSFLGRGLHVGMLPVNIKSCFQCFDTVGWVTGRASGMQKSCSPFPKGSPLEAFGDIASQKRG